MFTHTELRSATVNASESVAVLLAERQVLLYHAAIERGAQRIPGKLLFIRRTDGVDARAGLVCGRRAVLAVRVSALVVRGRRRRRELDARAQVRRLSGAEPQD